MSRSAPLGAPDEARNVLAITPFRRLWISLTLSSLGDWLSLLALMSLAAIFTADASTLVQYLAVSGVVLIKLAPSIVLSPLVAALADRLDRRWTMVAGDVLRALLYVSIPLVGLFFPGFSLEWLLIAAFLAEVVELFWTPAKDAAVPALVPRGLQRQAGRLCLLVGYGTAPVAALLFAALASVGNLLGALAPSLASPEADVALYLNGLMFLVAAIVVAGLPIPKHKSAGGGRTGTRDADLLRSVWTGRRAAGTSPLGRGLVLGMLGALAAGGTVVGVGRLHVEGLGAGNAGFGVVFAAVFAGMALGMLAGPRILKKFSRRRLFGVSAAVAGLALLFAGAVADMVLTAVLTTLLGVGAGIAWGLGTVLLAEQAEDAEDGDRDRALAFLHGCARVVLVAAAAFAALAAGLIGDYTLPLGPLTYDLRGSGVVLMAVGLVAVVVAWISYRQVNRDDPEAGPGLVPELVAALRGVDLTEDEDEEEPGHSGAFIVLEGGEGAGKSTQVRELTVWLREQGFEVVGTRQPGATKLGMRLRGLLLDRENSHITPRAEVLLYAADKADHVEQEILPALRRGAVVISDRYVDSLLAYQGAGRDLAPDEIRGISDWATQDLVPDLTVLLDVSPEAGLSRLGGPADRIESESLEFHDRVRKGFLALAKQAPERYLVVDASEPQDRISKEIRRRVRSLLPDPVDSSSEAVTGMIPVIKND
ncbi:dTMP kinase [Nocardiopsis sp. NRRL B-16309]|uniref:dTMP kinase n=1 Tax=Nocardiopsis sp. NRRL B-16309 TaxID=1519494 RepID=UPI0006AFD58F|nr:dTMP kinase [Nocardiopsis sp. NRRL B-16309]KOX16424.1 thymidylate kinase [Nocardiopsis sp. NRRL B-16309]